MRKRWRFILRRLVSQLVEGLHRSPRKGPGGIELASFREYQPGDAVRSISYRQSLKRWRYYVRENVIEKGMACLFIIDRSRSNYFGLDRSKIEVQDELLSFLAPAVAEGNNQVGFLVGTDRIERYDPPRFGAKTVCERIKLIQSYEPKSQLTDLDAIFRFVNNRGAGIDLIFILSDFYSETDYEPALRLLVAKHDVIPMVLEAPLESRFPKPPGLFFGRDLEKENFFWGYEFSAAEDHFKLFKSLDLDFVVLKTDEQPKDWLNKLSLLFERRRKRRRIRK